MAQSQPGSWVRRILAFDALARTPGGYGGYSGEIGTPPNGASAPVRSTIMR